MNAFIELELMEAGMSLFDINNSPTKKIMLYHEIITQKKLKMAHDNEKANSKMK